MTEASCACRWLRRATRMELLLVAFVCAAALAAALRPSSAGAFTLGSCPAKTATHAAVAWGGNSKGELGLGYRTTSDSSPATVTELDEVKEIQPGFQSTVALLESCTLESWGAPFQGGLGDGINGVQRKPVPVGYWTGTGAEKRLEPLGEVKQVSIENGGEPHGMALQYNGTVWTWGASELGERGNGEKDWATVARIDEPEIFRPRDQPTQIGLREIEQIGAGSKQDYALGGPSKEVWAWGEDTYGQLGVDDPEDAACHGQPSPPRAIPCVLKPLVVKTEGTNGVEALTGVEKIAVGLNTTYALRGGGRELFGWGSNKSGQLMGREEQVRLATKLPWTPPSAIVEISAGDGTAFARLANGSVYAWGTDEHGELGLSPEVMPEVCLDKEKCTRQPVAVAALEHVVQIAPGDQHTYVIKEEVTEESGQNKRVIYTFGNTYGKTGELLGLGSEGEALKGALFTPTPIEGLPSVAKVAAGRTIGAAVLEGSGPPPAVSILPVPGEAGFAIEWGKLAEAYDLIWLPVGGKQSGSLETSCDPTRPEGILCEGEQEVLHLAPEPYLFQLYAGPVEQKGHLRSRSGSKRYTVSGKPEAPAGAPLSLTAPEIEAAAEAEAQAEEYLAQVGHPVKVKEGTWSSESPVTVTRQWLRCDGYGLEGAEATLGEECEPIHNKDGQLETGTTYEPTAEDIGHTVVVAERAANEKSEAGRPTVVESEPVIVRGTETDEGENSEPAGENPPIVPAPPTNEVAPKIAGQATVTAGQTLTVDTGVWSDELVPALSNDKWYRCDSDITDEIGGEEQELGSGCKVIREPAGEGHEEVAHEGSTYTTGPADIGSYVEVDERAGNSGGYAYLKTSPVAVEASTPPVLETGGRPKIDYPEPLKTPFNDVQIEQELTANPGAWSNSATSYEYLWERCSAPDECTEITEGTSKHQKLATKEHYVVAAADKGKTIRVRVVAKNGAGASEPAYSAETVAVPLVPEPLKNQASPAIVGADGHSLPAHQGSRVSVTPGAWILPAASYTYLETIEEGWRRCTVEGGSETCAAIAKAETTSRCAIVDGHSVECVCHAEGPALCICGSSDEHECTTKGETPGAAYGLTAEDVGSKIHPKETTQIPGTTSTASPTSSEWVEVLGTVPVSVSAPKIEGVAKQDDTLTEIHGTWENSPSGYGYQWLRCSGEACEAIPGATQQTYDATAQDMGHTLAVEETASNATGDGQPARSLATATVLPHEPTLESAPAIDGVDQQEHKLTASTGAWAYSPTSYRYQWLRCVPESSECVNIIGATGPEYELQHADVNSSVSVQVTAQNAGGWNSADSEPTAPVRVGEPVIERIAPDGAPVGGGTIVEISGQNLGEATAVEFGFSGASSFESTPTSIKAVVPPGEGTVSVTVATRFGGASASSEADLFTYAAAPNITAVEPAKGSPAGGGTVLITGEDLGEASAVSFGQAAAASFKVLSPSAIEAVAPAGAAGTVELSVTTPSGTSTRSTGDDYTYVGPPTVTSVEPDKGSTAGGQLVTISGEWLEEASTVSFEGHPGTIKADSATTITAEAPPGAAGTATVTVTTPYGTSATNEHDGFTYVAPPAVSKVEPARGPLAGGTTTTITGEGLGEATEVTFAGRNALIKQPSTATSVIVEAPAGTGTADIAVTTRYGGASATDEHDKFTYVGAPVISGLTPNTGSEEGGTDVIITGENLAEASEVRFGTTKASSFNVLSATAIEAVAPSSAKPGAVEISVTTPYGQSHAVEADKFTYGPPPHVAAVTPSTGPASGGTQVTITGKDLAGATVVEFGGIPAEIVSPGGAEMIVQAPSGVVGEAHVTVTTPYGTSTKAGKNLFTYKPTITSVTPNSGPAAGGTEVKVTGSGFVAGSEGTVLQFGSTRGTSVSCASSTECTVTSPKHASGKVEMSATVDGISSPNTAADFTFSS